MSFVRHREGIYWCPAPLRDEDQCSYKVCSVADVQAVPPPPVEEYVSDSTVGSDSEVPATSRRGPSRITMPRHTQQTAGKIPASHAATQVTEAEKRRGKWTRSAESEDTTTKSSDVETFDVEGEEGVMQSLKATMALSPDRQATETSRPAPGVQGLSTSSIGPADDAGSNKRFKKAPPKPCKLNLQPATK
jgi:hypothetical protein